MPKIFLKRINKEIENFNNKNYLSNNNNFSNYLITFLDNLNVEIVISDYDKYGYADKYFLLIKDLQTNKLFLQIQIPETYPFKPYSVINYNNIFLKSNKNLLTNSVNLCYAKYMNNVYEKIKYKNKDIYKFFYKNLYGIESRFLNLQKNNCYCCASITCNDIWSPSITFNNLIFDHIEIQFIETYSSDIGYKYLCSIYNFNNELYQKLPQEIYEKIFQYV